MTAFVNTARFVRAPIQAVARRQYSAAASSAKPAAPAARFSKKKIAIGLSVAAAFEGAAWYFIYKKRSDATA